MSGAKFLQPLQARVLPVLLISALPSAAFGQTALPSDPTVISGDIAVSNPSAQTLRINQTGQTGIVEWGSFSIGSGNTVTFDNGNGATLNRVTGNETSNILGSLDATGSVYLLNKNGVFFGPDGVVRTSGDFVASTLDVTNEDFLNKGDTTFAGSSNATILNFGEVGSLGGNVALIAREVFNEGIVKAPNGTAALVAGREILMRDIALDHGLFVVRIGGEDTSVTDKGSIIAAEAELRANGGNIYALAGNTNGTIKATGVAKKGGRVFLTAGGGRIETTKTVKAQNGNGTGGRITVNAGTIDASNLYDASASSGKGGFVELYATAEAAFSGKILAFGDGTPNSGGFAEVSGVETLSYTGSTDTGGGTLLLDPNNIEVNGETQDLAGSSVIDPSNIIDDLAVQNVILQTSGTDGNAGTIFVGLSLEYDSSFDLTFLAHGDIFVSAPILNEGSGDINLVSGWDGSTSTLAFDPTPFLNADIFNPTIFGNNIDLDYTLNGSNITADGATILENGFTNVSVGTVSGETRVFANSLGLFASDDSGVSFSSMLGVRVDNSLFNSGNTITGDITVRTTDRIDLEGGLDTEGFVQIGHVGSGLSAIGENSADVDADIVVETAGDITLDAGEADGSYALIGHGSVDTCAPLTCSQSGGTRQGDITVFAGGEISLDEGLNSSVSPPLPIRAWIGHGTINRADVSNADIDIEADSFDQNAFTTNASGDLGRFDPNIISEGLDGGSFTLLANDTGLQFANNESIDATDGELIIATSGNLQFGSNFNVNDFGTEGRYVFATDGRFFNVEGEDLFLIGSGTWFVYSNRPDQDTGGLRVLDADDIVYDQPFDLEDPFLLLLEDDEGVPKDLNQDTLAYIVDPIITVADTSFTYGQDATLNPDFTFTIDSSPANPADFGFDNLTFGFDSEQVSFSSNGFVNAGSYTEAVEPVFDFPAINTLFGTWFEGDLTVSPATLTVTLADEDKTEANGYTGDVTFSGFVTGETDALITSGPTFSYTGGDGSDGTGPGLFTVSGNGSAESSGNYTFDDSDTAQLQITLDETGSEEEPLGELPEIPRDDNPSNFGRDGPPQPILVNGVSDGDDETGGDGDGFIEVSPANTTKIVEELQKGRDFCEGLAQQEYVIDCMGDSLQKAAEQLPEGGDYQAVKAALEDASIKLAELARQNASQTLTRGLVQANGQQSSRRFTPVASEALAALNAQASAIIDEAQTVLLRSAQNSDRRKIHYQRIAEAVGSNKILLRST